MTWRQLVAIEPDLAELLDAAREVRDPGPPERFCRFRAWQPLKRRMRRLLDAHVEHLGAEYFQAHDEAYRSLFNALPQCRGCRCNRGLTRAERLEEVRQSDEANDGAQK